MDPDENLKELRRLMKRAEDDELDNDEVCRAGELFCELDEWIERGGFLPKAWQPRKVKAP